MGPGTSCTWKSLPHYYRNIPQINVDKALLQLPQSSESSAATEGRHDSDGDESTATASIPSQSTVTAVPSNIPSHHSDSTQTAAANSDSTTTAVGDNASCEAATVHIETVDVAPEAAQIPQGESVDIEASGISIANNTDSTASILSRRVRQALAQLSSYTYTVDDVILLQKMLDSLKQCLAQYRTKTSLHLSKTAFRRNRRIVKHNILAAKLKRRLAVIGANRRLKKRRHYTVKKTTSRGVLGVLMHKVSCVI